MGLILQVKATFDKLTARVILGPKPFSFEPDYAIEGSPIKNILQMSRDELNDAEVLAPPAELHAALPEIVTVTQHSVTRGDTRPRSEPFFSPAKATIS